MKLFRTDVRPSRLTQIFLSGIPFLLLFGAYVVGSEMRHKENPNDKIMPTVTALANGFTRAAIHPEEEDDELTLWIDTMASAKRFGIALLFMFLAVLIGLNMGVFPYLEAAFYPFVVFFDKIPAMSILPILFILFGLGELSKTMLIIIGVMPTIIIDAYLRAKAIPEEQLHKTHTLGASEQEICYRIILPQIFPKMLDTIRLNLKSMMMLLIAGESLAASVGLGYRIFVVRRYMAMDTIIPYVLWMTVLLFLADLLFQRWIKRSTWVDK